MYYIKIKTRSNNPTDIKVIQLELEKNIFNHRHLYYKIIYYWQCLFNQYQVVRLILTYTSSEVYLI